MSLLTLKQAWTLYVSLLNDRLPADEHCHDHHEVIVVQSGQYIVKVAGEIYQGGVGSVFYFPPGFRHQPRYRHTGENIFMILHWVEKSTPNNDRPMNFEDPSGRWLDTTAWLIELFAKERKAKTRSASNGLLAALLTAFPSTQHEERHEASMWRIHHYLSYHFHESITLEKLAKIACISREHLIRKYRQEYALTPMQELQRLRVEAARRLLANSNLPLSAVADRTGFSDAAHLSRTLKRHLQTPVRSMRNKKTFDLAPDRT